MAFETSTEPEPPSKRVTPSATLADAAGTTGVCVCAAGCVVVSVTGGPTIESVVGGASTAPAVVPIRTEAVPAVVAAVTVTSTPARSARTSPVVSTLSAVASLDRQTGGWRRSAAGVRPPPDVLTRSCAVCPTASDGVAPSIRTVASALWRDTAGPEVGERKLEASSPQAVAARRIEKSTGA
jgi:hypothetical protein